MAEVLFDPESFDPEKIETYPNQTTTHRISCGTVFETMEGLMMAWNLTGTIKTLDSGETAMHSLQACRIVSLPEGGILLSVSRGDNFPS